jgi:hypothetical protein
MFDVVAGKSASSIVKEYVTESDIDVVLAVMTL